MSKNIRSLSYRKELDDNLFEELVKAKELNSTEADDKLHEISETYLVGKSVVLGTSSFYDFLKDENCKKKIFVCNGSACLLSGNQEKLKENLSDFFFDSEIGEVACVGRCHENGSLLYKGRTFSCKTKDDVKDVIEKETKSDDNSYRVGQNTEDSILTDDIPDIKDWYRLLINYPDNKVKAIDELERSNLRGRGGAGFPFFIKLNTCKAAEADCKYIVCNADEGDPGAFSDMYLMEHHPHKILFGMMISALIVGATKGVIYIRAEYPQAIWKIRGAINELKQMSLLGENILGIGFNFDFKIIKGAGAYICGEETSLLNSIEGLRPEVRTRPPFPAVEGLFGKPTVLSNVETFANIRWILEHGGEVYSKIGKGRSTGTKLVSLDSHFKHPGIYEISMGTPLKQIVFDIAGGFTTNIKAMQIGGPLGGIVPISKIDSLTLDFESFNEHGFLLGHASMVCIPENFPMIKYLAHLFEFTKKESCGKCFPCRLGTQRGHELIGNALDNNKKISKSLFDDLLETLEIGSLCALGGGLPLPVKNALQYFDKELRPYFNPENHG